jgi:phospholipase/lecithinase/hemolysin
MNWLLIGSVGGGVTIVKVDGNGMTYSAAQKLADEINAMYAFQQSVHPTRAGCGAR